MRLAKLTMCGFKSFADRTEFSFEDDITGIVGPNGCGKSNVVDAIKWVLGERSSKSLRGKEMIDVIFAGSAGRKPAGMASVTLTFENPELGEGEAPARRAGGAGAGDAEVGADAEEGEAGIEGGEEADASPILDRRARRALPVDTDVVEVERRLYRDGKSRYLINGRIARLRDIRDLFLDTGVGADAYSIIEQGKVDAMLLATPPERRGIFEEAAGIARYRRRRVEAQRKLERAELNLTRTRERLQSTERRLRIVRGQASKARRFRELDAELRASRMALAFDEYDDLVSRLSGLTSRLADLEERRAEGVRAVERLEAEHQEIELRRHEVTGEHRRAESERAGAEHAAAQASQRAEMLERSLAEARARARADAERSEEASRALGAIESDIEDRREEVARLEALLSESDARIESLSGSRSEAVAALSDAQREAAQHRRVLEEISRDRARLLAAVEADEKRSAAMREQSEALSGREGERRGELDRTRHETTRTRDEIRRREQRLRGLEARLEELDGRASALAAGRGELAERVAEGERRRHALEGRSAALRELIESRVGLGEAVRDVLDRRDRGEGFAHVIAPLAELLDAEASCAAAVEAALGGRLRSLVVSSSCELPSPSELASLRGRVSFMPLHWTGGAPPLDPGERELIETGRVVPLRGVVRARSMMRAGRPHHCVRVEVEGLLDRLLGRTYLVADADAALLLAGGPLAGATFVTREGQVIEPDGRVLAGPLSGDGDAEPGGLLQRRSELNRLETELAALRAILDASREELRSVDAEAEEMRASQRELSEAIGEEQRALLAGRSRLERLEGEAGRLERDLAGILAEREQLGARLEREEQDRAELEERAAALDRLAGEEEERLVGIEACEREAREGVERASERLSTARVEAGRLAEQGEAAKRDLRRLESERDEAQRRVRDLAAQAERAEGKIGDHEGRIEEASGEASRQTARASELAERVEELGKSLGALEARAREVGERLGAARARAQHIERDWHSLEVARRELEVKREGVEERVRDELSLDLAFEHAEYRAMMSDGGVAPIDRGGLASEVEALRESIRRLGNVNLDAIEEEDRLTEQNEDLVRQVADIDAARARLTDLIGRLDEVSRVRFDEAFERIKGHFAGRDGMFRRLFGGGRAELRLMPLVREEDGRRVQTEEVDPLESGIEIIAKPPGKEPRSISQLSGGEKTLTAVALLLAIFRSKPSCFCVLDEVDAALDDANVERYADVLRRFTDRSRFIVITHNKRTMASVDRLFGVTMQERGVSTRVSVRFNEVGSGGEIDAGDAGGAGARANGRPRAGGDAVEAGHADAREGESNGEYGESRPSGALRRALASMHEPNRAT